MRHGISINFRTSSTILAANIAAACAEKLAGLSTNVTVSLLTGVAAVSVALMTKANMSQPALIPVRAQRPRL